MEYSSIIHHMNESFQYKLSGHQYIVKLITKKNDCTRVRIGYLEKYFREKHLPGIPSQVFYLEMKKGASTDRNDYYEASLSDMIHLSGVNEKVDAFLRESQNEYLKIMAEKARRLEGSQIQAIALCYFFQLEDGRENRYYGNYKFFTEEPADTMDMFTLIVHQADQSWFLTPEWAKGAVFYQIFPERFAPTDGAYSPNWFETPMGIHSRTNGTLEGIRQKIPYLKSLGIDAVYLTPIFTALSSHRYDSVDYMQIDPLLGTAEQFRALVEELHRNGIRILLDLVFNHSSTKFFAFADLLKNQERSPYRNWYFISKFPVEPNLPSDYPGFAHSPWMPKLNTSDPACRAYLLNVAKYYLSEFHVDGYRLDVANEVTHDFWIEFRKVCKGINPDCLIMGEIWYDSTVFLRGDQFDSVMNYTYFDAIRGLLTGRFTTEEFAAMIQRERGESALTYYHHSNLLIGSHDTDRINHALSDSPEKFRLAMTLLFTLPGSPILYYGDEKRMDGGKDPDCRRGMIFDENYHHQDFAFVQKLIRLKHRPCMKKGELVMGTTGPYLSYTREHTREALEVILNPGAEAVSLPHLRGETDLISQQHFGGTLMPYGQIILERKPKP